MWMKTSQEQKPQALINMIANNPIMIKKSTLCWLGSLNIICIIIAKSPLYIWDRLIFTLTCGQLIKETLLVVLQKALLNTAYGYFHFYYANNFKDVLFFLWDIFFLSFFPLHVFWRRSLPLSRLTCGVPHDPTTSQVYILYTAIIGNIV